MYAYFPYGVSNYFGDVYIYNSALPGFRTIIKVSYPLWVHNTGIDCKNFVLKIDSLIFTVTTNPYSA